MPDRHALTPLSTPLERRLCPICNRPFKVLPTSQIVYDSQFCAWQGVKLNPRYNAYGNIVPPAGSYKSCPAYGRDKNRPHPWIKD